MVIDLKMCRFDNVPWGFRLVGGSDFEIPLTVVKVTEGSIADEAGMRVGDVIVRINDDATSSLSHNDAHKVISHCGNSFFLGIMREEEGASEIEREEEVVETHQDYIQVPQSYTPDSMLGSSVKSPISEISERPSEAISEVSNISDQCPKPENCEDKVSDEEIAELMSGEAEVLKEHNVIGVNFNRIFPKPGVCMTSAVLRQLNEEAIKTHKEKEKERRKWTTFLQKPDRPVPKSKHQIEEEAKAAAAYKVKIIKQTKPRVAPDHPPTPPPQPEPEPPKEEIIVEENPPKEPEEPEELPTDSQVPNLEPISTDEQPNAEEINEIKTEEEENTEVAPQEENTPLEDEEKSEPEEAVVSKTEEELILEKQLADVQKQLLALSTLPSTIQATLDAVTKQLADLLPTFKLQPVAPPIQEEETEQTEDSEEPRQEEELQIEEIQQTEINEEENTTLAETSNDSDQPKEILAEEHHDVQEPSEPTPEQLEKIRQEDEQRKIDEELNYKKQKEQGLIEELQQRLIHDRIPKRPARAFGPLTPQQRPQILPGGRRWYKPKDAYNEEFIAETLSSQAELIIGSTLGVNFMKYQKPEKKIDLEKSEVYKVIHHLEREPKRGIEVRPSKVLAEEDVRNRATPISCG